jgi:hypothetical protein
MDKSEDQILRFYQNELEDLLCELINVWSFLWKKCLVNPKLFLGIRIFKIGTLIYPIIKFWRHYGIGKDYETIIYSLKGFIHILTIFRSNFYKFPDNCKKTTVHHVNFYFTKM